MLKHCEFTKRETYQPYEIEKINIDRVCVKMIAMDNGPEFTLTLHTQTGKNRCAHVIARHLRACSEQDLTYGQVLFILSQPARAHIWRTLTRFSSAWVCNVRVYKGSACVTWCKKGVIELHVIDRGRVMQNTLIESFVRKTLEECLTNICMGMAMMR